MFKEQAQKITISIIKYRLFSTSSSRWSDRMCDFKSDELYHIGGIPVHFPCKPYPSQIAIMGRIIKGLREKQNCLLESPTGSGKSLALLCSTLAWQKVMTERIDKYNDLVCQDVTDPDVLLRVLGEELPKEEAYDMEMPPSPGMSTPVPVPANDATSGVPQNTATDSPEEGGFIRADDENDFKDVVSTCNSKEHDAVLTPPLHIEESQQAAAPASRISLMKVPKIYYGSRTHKQLHQIIRELRKTKYKDVRSAVLGSREHTCIHPVVSKSSNKTDDCNELRNAVKGQSSCSFYHASKQLRLFDQAKHYGIEGAWDLEDLVKAGRKHNICPYYTARALSETAQIVFCPYNYLTDPRIREMLQIDLKEHVIILDEAHNVEDNAREAASLTLTQKDLIDAKNDLEKVAGEGVQPAICNSLAKVISLLCLWMDSHRENMDDYVEYNRSCKIFSGEEAAQQFGNIVLGPKNVANYSKSLHRLLDECQQDEESETKKVAPSGLTVQLLKGLFQGLNYLYRCDMTYCHDYKVALVKSQIYGYRNNRSASTSGWVAPNKPTTSVEFSLNMWCLNPNVTFSTIGNVARCIILTSGTLSPMNSFQSELGINFPIQLEANHVIKSEQVWVGTLSSGPKNYTLTGTYKNTESYDFQDEVGQTVLEICKVIPGGVLCFFPSYAIMDKMKNRWMNTLIWSELSNVKVVTVEPKKSSEFESTIQEFYAFVEETKEDDELTGALLLAVCRGKVSEGLDFSDDNARAVICVGIPFPSIKDIQVDLKKKYNDRFYKQRQLLSGSEWYQIQAYRALNQALGRCIRHRYDWGALILLDERYQRNLRYGENRYVQGLSKWIRKSIMHQPSFSFALQNLKKFATKMINSPPGGSNCPPIMKDLPEIESKSIEFLPAPSFSNTDNSSAMLLEPLNPTGFQNQQPEQNMYATPTKEEHVTNPTDSPLGKPSPVFISRSSLNSKSVASPNTTMERSQFLPTKNLKDKIVDCKSPLKKRRKTFSIGGAEENCNKFANANYEQEKVNKLSRCVSDEDMFANFDNSYLSDETYKPKGSKCESDSVKILDISNERNNIQDIDLSNVGSLHSDDFSDGEDFQKTESRSQRKSTKRWSFKTIRIEK